MRFESLSISGAYRIVAQPTYDERGAFARVFCAMEFADAGLPLNWVQASLSFNGRAGTLRGMHFQWPPSREGKLVRCVRGALLDVLIDLRPDSPTYLDHVSLQLSADSRDSVFIPDGVAHGFQTLVDSTEVYYQMTDVYAPDLAAGFRWNDPAFGINWPVANGIVISSRDAKYPDFVRRVYESELQRRRQ